MHTFSATNPCHVYDLALALHAKGQLFQFVSGYPKWKLDPPADFPLKVHGWRTLVTYGMQRLPERLRIADPIMFRWQDIGFDRAAAAGLEAEGFYHGLPGQCLEQFRRCRQSGIATVLNHASGPLDQQRLLVEPEYARAGLNLDSVLPLPATYEARLSEEMQLSDFHCVASSVVRAQLISAGVKPHKIWTVPYGADSKRFAKRTSLPQGPFKICFVARQSLRKGVHYLLQALESVDSSGWELHCYGMPSFETAEDFASYRGGAAIFQHGNLTQHALAAAMRGMDVLVLPSVEEAFGLVVVQALSCGLPCIVSDRVGAKDLVRDGESGAIVPFGNIGCLAQALVEWSRRRLTVAESFPWSDCAQRLIDQANVHLNSPSTALPSA